MLAYILGIRKWGNERIINRGSLRGIANRGKRDYKQGQLKGLQIGAKRFQIGVEIKNRGETVYKPAEGLQIGAEQLYFSRIFGE